MKATLPLSLVLWALVGAIVPCGAIIGGSVGVDGRFPYFVSLVDANGAHRCGGALIAPDMVLTAASCNAADLDRARVGFGSSSSPEVIAISQSYIHPSWRSQDSSYDIMVLKLADRATAQWVFVNSNITYPPTNSAPQIEAIGIGRTSRTSGLSSTVHVKSLIAIAGTSCTALIKTGNATGTYKTLTSDHQCFTDYSFNSGGQCFGDQGGPMIQVGNTVTNDVLVAVMSKLSGGCASTSPSYPTRGTKSSYAFYFIQDTICFNSVAAPAYACTSRVPTFRPTPRPTPPPVACKGRGQTCTGNGQCCSRRCVSRTCQASA